MLYSGGRPTSVELLLLVVVAKLALTLSCHPPLVLHHLFRLVGAARWLVSLGGVEVLKVRRGVSAGAGAAFELDRVGSLGTTGTTRLCMADLENRVSWSLVVVETQPAALDQVCILTDSGIESGRAGGKEWWLELTSATRHCRHAKHLAALDQVFNGTLDLCI